MQLEENDELPAVNYTKGALRLRCIILTGVFMDLDEGRLFVYMVFVCE